MTKINITSIFYIVYRKKKNDDQLIPSFKVIGTYLDIRDALHGIIKAYRRNGGNYWIESTTVKPRHWLHPSRYKNEDLN